MGGMNKKLKNAALCIYMFLFFALLTIAALFFGIEAVRCILHFVNGTDADIMEIICLGFVALAGGGTGTIWFICDSDVIET